MTFDAKELHDIAEVQTTFHWLATFEGSPFAEAEALSKRVTTHTLPAPEHQIVDVIAHGFQFPTPGVVNYHGAIDITFFESVTADIVNTFQTWLHNIYEGSLMTGDISGQQLVGYADTFGTITLDLKDKQETNKQQYKLHKCLLASFNPGGDLTDGVGTLDYFKPTANISYAWYNWLKL